MTEENGVATEAPATVGGPQAHARLRDPRDVLAEQQAIERQYRRHYNSDEYLWPNMWAGIEQSKCLGYNASPFVQMAKHDGAVEANRMVVDTLHPAEGFVKLAWDIAPRCLDLTNEQLVLNYPSC